MKFSRKKWLEISKIKVYNSKEKRKMGKKREKALETSDFADIYKEIADKLGTDTAVAIHALFKGQQIQFPQRLYKKEAIYRYIKENYNGNNVRELSQEFGYSDRRIKQIVNSE